MSSTLTKPRSTSPRRAIPADGAADHIVLDGVSWDFYEALLRELGDRPIRVAYDGGRMEVMSPRWDHENPGEFIGRMVFMLALLRGMPLASGGSTTFRSRAKRKGLEPDRCFFFEHAAKLRGKKGEWNAQSDPPPELAIEVDITSKSIDREPIYAALGVPEIWRWDGFQLECLILHGNAYVARAKSKAFPFLEPAKLKRFLDRLRESDETTVIKEFTSWVKRNRWAK